MTGELRAVLFDSGGVLIRPVGGRWNPRPDFEETVLRYDPTVTPERFARAIAAGEEYFAGSAAPPERDEYHRVLLNHLAVPSTPGLVADLRLEVPAASVVELFPDVVGTLEELARRGVRMAVVSDAWPELPSLHAELGIADHFEAYAISAVLGCVKPDPRMYRHASEALGLPPEECVFVDDDPELVEAAVELGYEGRVLTREPTALRGSGVISGLSELLDLF
ncbi:HAD-IA family hydrolase [Streptomyces sp. NPDC047072]|uniref:HAD family hydrolase n=1 Tax=Streptomyces sp. NPDC047072 TaxID=3154809 RepID=UPI0034099631